MALPRSYEAVAATWSAPATKFEEGRGRRAPVQSVPAEAPGNLVSVAPLGSGGSARLLVGLCGSSTLDVFRVHPREQLECCGTLALRWVQ